MQTIFVNNLERIVGCSQRRKLTTLFAERSFHKKTTHRNYLLFKAVTEVVVHANGKLGIESITLQARQEPRSPKKRF